MSKRPACQPSCDCRGCECPNCPNASTKTSTQEFGSSSYVCDHGTKPKCTCNPLKRKESNTLKPKESATLKPKECTTKIPDCCFEPEPIPDPKRTESIMKLLKFDKNCFCKVVTRALRADVHRYLGMQDRHQDPQNMCSHASQTSSCCQDA